MDWLYNLWNSLEWLGFIYKFLKFAPAILGVIGTVIGIYISSLISDRINILKDERREARIQALEPYRQPINAVTATVQIIVASNQKAAGRQGGPGFSLKFVIGGEEVLEGSSEEHVATPLAGGVVRYRSEFPVYVRKSARGISVSSLQDTESIKLVFYGMPDNTAIHLGLLDCLINGSIRLRFDLGNQTAKGKEIDIPEIQKTLQALNP